MVEPKPAALTLFAVSRLDGGYGVAFAAAPQIGRPEGRPAASLPSRQFWCRIPMYLMAAP